MDRESPSLKLNRIPISFGYIWNQKQIETSYTCSKKILFLKGGRKLLSGWLSGECLRALSLQLRSLPKTPMACPHIPFQILFFFQQRMLPKTSLGLPTYNSRNIFFVADASALSCFTAAGKICSKYGFLVHNGNPAIWPIWPAGNVMTTSRW